MIIGIMGHGRSGKDEAAEFFVKHFKLRYGGTTSVVISKEVARLENITYEQAHSQRHERRQHWRDLGDEMRSNDCAALAREVLKGSDLLVGVRARVEIERVKQERLCDIILWVSRLGIPDDPTLEFGSEVCDIVIENHWGLEEYHKRLMTLGLALGLKG